MKLQLTTKYLFIEPFEEIEISDFTVLTGLNGVGKTHIINAINQGQIKIIDPEIHDAKIRLINLSISGIKEFIFDQNSVTSQKYNIYQSVIERFKKNPNAPIQDHLIYLHMSEWDNFLSVAKSANKEIDKLVEQDFINHEPIKTLTTGNPFDAVVFSDNFQELFNIYFQKIYANKINLAFALLDGIENNSAKNKDELVAIYGETPWDFVNRILKEIGFDYEMSVPKFTFPPEKFNIGLKKLSTNDSISLGGLSTGEEVIMSLILAMYNLKLNAIDANVILFDEPDASLHPSMIKYFLEVIKKVFIGENSLKVIITTHSPTTIALSDEANIFVVNLKGGTIEKTSKDAALKILTEGVPSFSINYENRRQVFVESPNDVRYYENLYRIFNKKLEKDISLNFIASGDAQYNKNGVGKNSCDIVQDVVKIMREAGNKFIWGIIDYDGKNKSGEFVKVLGENKRYSTENYFLDPLLISILILIEDPTKLPHINLNEDETYINIVKFNSDRLQNIVNYIIDRIKSNVNIDKDDLVSCNLCNGKIVMLPQWFINYQGHDLEVAIKKSFPILEKYRGEDEKGLKFNIIKKVIAIFPGLASQDLLDILLNVQK